MRQRFLKASFPLLHEGTGVKKLSASPRIIEDSVGCVELESYSCSLQVVDVQADTFTRISIVWNQYPLFITLFLD